METKDSQRKGLSTRAVAYLGARTSSLSCVPPITLWTDFAKVWKPQSANFSSDVLGCLKIAVQSSKCTRMSLRGGWLSRHSDMHFLQITNRGSHNAFSVYLFSVTEKGPFQEVGTLPLHTEQSEKSIPILKRAEWLTGCYANKKCISHLIYID